MPWITSYNAVMACISLAKPDACVGTVEEGNDGSEPADDDDSHVLMSVSHEGDAHTDAATGGAMGVVTPYFSLGSCPARDVVVAMGWGPSLNGYSGWVGVGEPVLPAFVYRLASALPLAAAKAAVAAHDPLPAVREWNKARRSEWDADEALRRRGDDWARACLVNGVFRALPVRAPSNPRV